MTPRVQVIAALVIAAAALVGAAVSGGFSGGHSDAAGPRRSYSYDEGDALEDYARSQAARKRTQRELERVRAESMAMGRAAVDVDGIDVGADRLPPQAGDVAITSVVVTIAGDGALTVNGDPVAAADLSARLAAIVADDGEVSLVLQAAVDVNYETVVRVMDTARTAGISKISLDAAP